MRSSTSSKNKVFLFYAAVQFLLDCGQFVLTGFQNWTLLKFALGFVIDRRILIEVQSGCCLDTMKFAQ